MQNRYSGDDALKGQLEMGTKIVLLDFRFYISTRDSFLSVVVAGE